VQKNKRKRIGIILRFNLRPEKIFVLVVISSEVIISVDCIYFFASLTITFAGAEKPPRPLRREGVL